MFSHLMTNVGGPEPSILICEKWYDKRHHNLAQAIELGSRAFYWQEEFGYQFRKGMVFLDLTTGQLFEVANVQNDMLLLSTTSGEYVAKIWDVVKAVHDGRVWELG